MMMAVGMMGIGREGEGLKGESERSRVELEKSGLNYGIPTRTRDWFVAFGRED